MTFEPNPNIGWEVNDEESSRLFGEDDLIPIKLSIVYINIIYIQIFSGKNTQFGDIFGTKSNDSVVQPKSSLC